MHALSMVNERKTLKGEVEGDEVKKTGSATIGFKTLCTSQTCQHSALNFQITVVKKVLKKQTVSIVRCKNKEKNKRKFKRLFLKHPI